jgi:hypothetical protein
MTLARGMHMFDVGIVVCSVVILVFVSPRAFAAKADPEADRRPRPLLRVAAVSPLTPPHVRAHAQGSGVATGLAWVEY